MEKYTIEPSGNGWLLTDKEHNILIFWENKRFNSTQTVINISDLKAEDIMKIARIIREASDWLVEHHRNKI